MIFKRQRYQLHNQMEYH